MFAPRSAMGLLVLGILTAACTSSSTGSGQPPATPAPQSTGAGPTRASGQATPAVGVTQAASTRTAAVPAKPAGNTQDAAARTGSRQPSLQTVRDVRLHRRRASWGSHS